MELPSGDGKRISHNPCRARCRNTWFLESSGGDHNVLRVKDYSAMQRLLQQPKLISETSHTLATLRFLSPGRGFTHWKHTSFVHTLLPETCASFSWTFLPSAKDERLHHHHHHHHRMLILLQNMVTPSRSHWQLSTKATHKNSHVPSSNNRVDTKPLSRIAQRNF